jgi:hypothetical protein
MSIFRKKKPEVTEPAEAAALKRSSDCLLRRAGFRIWARVKGAEAVWERNGHYFSETKAWIIANQEAVKASGAPPVAPDTTEEPNAGG